MPPQGEKETNFNDLKNEAEHNVPVEGAMKKQNEMTAFNYFFALMCIFAMGYFIFSIFYTYVYYPPIWKNIIEGFMEDFGLLPPNPARKKVLT